MKKFAFISLALFAVFGVSGHSAASPVTSAAMKAVPTEAVKSGATNVDWVYVRPTIYRYYRVRPTVYLGPRYVRPTIYLSPRYVRPTVYLSPRYVRPTVYLSPSYVRPTYYLRRYYVSPSVYVLSSAQGWYW